MPVMIPALAASHVDTYPCQPILGEGAGTLTLPAASILDIERVDHRALEAGVVFEQGIDAHAQE